MIININNIEYTSNTKRFVHGDKTTYSKSYLTIHFVSGTVKTIYFKEITGASKCEEAIALSKSPIFNLNEYYCQSF